MVDIIQVLLFNNYGEIILQKRSKTKRHNTNMIDKSIGGHINTGDLPNHSVMLETVQELQVPSLVLQTKIEFLKSYKLLKKYTESLAIIQHINTKVLNMQRKFKDETIPITSNTYFYLGIYNGKVKNIDREAKGILYYTLNELEEEIEQYPDAFTDDIKVLLREFDHEIRSFIHIIKTK